jgi:hypothetical protein
MEKSITQSNIQFTLINEFSTWRDNEKSSFGNLLMEMH